MEAITIKPLGLLHTPYRSAAEAPVQGRLGPGGRGEVEVFEEFAPALQDVEGFSHLTLLYYFHEAGEEKLIVKPFLDEVSRGVFATRHPRRPNHIGLTTVRLIERRGNTLLVEGVDMFDGTPLLDLKPYVPAFDHTLDEVKVGWLSGKVQRWHDRHGKNPPRGAGG